MVPIYETTRKLGDNNSHMGTAEIRVISLTHPCGGIVQMGSFREIVVQLAHGGR